MATRRCLSASLTARRPGLETGRRCHRPTVPDGGCRSPAPPASPEARSTGRSLRWVRPLGIGKRRFWRLGMPKGSAEREIAPVQPASRFDRAPFLSIQAALGVDETGDRFDPGSLEGGAIEVFLVFRCPRGALTGRSLVVGEFTPISDTRRRQFQTLAPQASWHRIHVDFFA
jgi:hypothetical protein